MSASEQAKVRLGEETEMDVFSECLAIIRQLLELADDLNPTVSEDVFVSLLQKMALNCDKADDLDKIAAKILFYL